MNRNFKSRLAGVACALAMFAGGAAHAQDEPAPEQVLGQLKADATAMRSCVSTKAATQWLDQAGRLEAVEPRTIWYRRDPKAALTSEQYEQLPEAERAGFRELNWDTYRYYMTFYGTPIAYGRALDLVAERAAKGSFRDMKFADFGCGGLGQLRMLALCGADTTGIDVDPLLEALYSRPEDQGEVASPGGKSGSVRLVTGYWPSDARAVEAVGTGYDVFISKNTLKRGYVNPAEPVDPRFTLQLGVDDATFLGHVNSLLKPGGLMVIYNIGPAPTKDGTYNPMGDVHSPYTREQFEHAGFEVVELDVDDTEMVRKTGKALAWDQQGMDLETDLFAMYTIVRKK